MGLNFGDAATAGGEPPVGAFPRSIGGSGRGGGQDPQMNAQLLTLILELLRRTQAQGSQTTQKPGPQATPPSINANDLLNRAFSRASPTQRTSPLGGIGNRQGLFTQTVQAPSGRDQTAASIASILQNVQNARMRKNQGRP